MSTIKFFEDKEKTIKVYPEIDPNGVEMGMTVGLADNLIAPASEKEEKEFNFAPTGGTEDIADGYAELRRLKGYTHSSTIEEKCNYNILAEGIRGINFNLQTFKQQITKTGVYNFIYIPVVTYNSPLISSVNKVTFARKLGQETPTATFVYQAEIAESRDTNNVITQFNSDTFAEKVNYQVDNYSFVYNEINGWMLRDKVAVTLSQYGINTVSDVPAGSIIEINYSDNRWYYGSDPVLLSSFGIVTTGAEIAGNSITINYPSNEWRLSAKDSSEDSISLSNYGIVITNGAAKVNDLIQIVYTAESVDSVVTVANPTALKSIGFNAYNVDGNNTLAGYSIDPSGTIVTAADNYVAYFKCLGGHTYTIYNKNAGAIQGVAYSERIPATYTTNLTILEEPATASSGQTLHSNSRVRYYQAEKDGYMCVSTTDINDLCCHLTWTGYRDEDYEEYWEQILAIPYRDANGNNISQYGLVYLDDTYFDEIDFDKERYYKRTKRIQYTSDALEDIKKKGVKYERDNEYIYYGIETQTYILDSKLASAIKVSDFGTFEFLDTDYKCKVVMAYEENLKDKLRRSVEVVDHKVDTIDPKTDLEKINNYPSVGAVFELAQNFWQALGLAIDTYSDSTVYKEGDYVVFNHRLYKSTQEQTEVNTLDLIPRYATITQGDIISDSIGDSFINNTFIQTCGLGDYTIKVSNVIPAGQSTGVLVTTIMDPNGNKKTYDSASELYSDLGITVSGVGVATITVFNKNYWD